MVKGLNDEHIPKENISNIKDDAEDDVEEELDDIIFLGPIGLGLSHMRPQYLGEIRGDKYKHLTD